MFEKRLTGHDAGVVDQDIDVPHLAANLIQRGTTSYLLGQCIAHASSVLSSLLLSYSQDSAVQLSYLMQPTPFVPTSVTSVLSQQRYFIKLVSRTTESWENERKEAQLTTYTQ